MLKLNRVAEALAAYDCALKLVPDNAPLLTNRAVALRRLDRPQVAAISARRALRSRPDFAQARFVEGVALLTLGDFSAGWRGYEARWQVGWLAAQRPRFTAPSVARPGSTRRQDHSPSRRAGPWRTLFSSCATRRHLAVQGARIVLEVQPELTRLLSGIAGVETVVARKQPLPHFDFHRPLLSLPLACATELATIPAEIPYVAPAEADVAAWRARLPRRRPLLGLAWSGIRLHDNDLNRSLRLATLALLLDLPEVTFVSLQHEVREEDAALLRSQPDLVQLEQAFRDFADTAAVVAALDAVISVDTAVAHLAGAMGKPLFPLLPFAADFRWLRERRDSPCIQPHGFTGSRHLAIG